MNVLAAVLAVAVVVAMLGAVVLMTAGSSDWPVDCF